MNLTLPISNLVNRKNYFGISGINSFEFKDIKEKLARTILCYDKDKKMLFHSNIGIIKNNFEDYFISTLPFLKFINVEIFSCTLGPVCSEYFIDDGRYICQSDILEKSDLKKLIKNRIKFIRNNFNGKIALENTNYFYLPAYEYICEPQFITEIIEENDIYFLLDIAHAIISAYNMKMNIREYLNFLPLDRCVEIHLSHIVFIDNILEDSHEIPTIQEYHIIDWLRDRIDFENIYFVIEYYNDFEKLEKEYKYLNKFLGEIKC